MKTKNMLQLPFDQYSRQVQVLDIINSIRGKTNKKYKILDVGGYKGVTSDLHTGDSVTVLDIYDVDEPNYIQGDGRKLPFKDEEFDFVVSFDVLEHIQKGDRKQFISELARVSKIATIIAAPVDTAENQKSEKLLDSLYKKMHGAGHPWLVEHIENGIPKSGSVTEVFNSNNLKTAVLYSNDIQLWVAMQGVIFTSSKFPELANEIDSLNTSYNQSGPFDSSEHKAENYREIVVGVKSESALRIINKKINNSHLSIDDKINIQFKIAETYLSALEDINSAKNKLEQRANGLEHACVELSKKINSLEITLNEIRNSRSYRMFSYFKKIKSKLKKII